MLTIATVHYLLGRKRLRFGEADRDLDRDLLDEREYFDLYDLKGHGCT